jgi:histone H2B
MAPKSDEQKAGKSKAEKKPVKKAEKKIKSDTKSDVKKKKSKKSVETYKIYIYKVLKQVIV